MKNSVTSELKKSITKVTGFVFQQLVYSDTRKNGLAVGVKVCYTEYSQPIIDQVVEDMSNKGFKLAYTTYNKPRYGYHSVPGTRFCFYKQSDIVSQQNVIAIQRPLGRLTLSADQVAELYDDKKCIDSILLMVINGDDTWENEFEVEFNRQDAKEFLTEYFSTCNYDQNYIRKVLEKL
jgi:hypothetical protein